MCTSARNVYIRPPDNPQMSQNAMKTPGDLCGGQQPPPRKGLYYGKVPLPVLATATKSWPSWQMGHACAWPATMKRYDPHGNVCLVALLQRLNKYKNSGNPQLRYKYIKYKIIYCNFKCVFFLKLVFHVKRVMFWCHQGVILTCKITTLVGSQSIWGKTWLRSTQTNSVPYNILQATCRSIDHVIGSRGKRKPFWKKERQTHETRIQETQTKNNNRNINYPETTNVVIYTYM